MTSIEPRIKAPSSGDALNALRLASLYENKDMSVISRTPSSPSHSLKRMTPIIFPSENKENNHMAVTIHKAKTYERKPYLCTVEEFGKTLRTLNATQKLSETELKDASLSFRETFQYEEYKGNVYLFPDFSSCKNEPIWKVNEKFTEGELLFCKILQEFLPVKIVLNKIVILERDFVLSLRKGHLKVMRSL